MRRDTKEMRSILPIALALVDEPDVHLVNKGRRLQGVVGPLVPKLPRGNTAELRIDEWQQLIERSLVAAIQSPSSAVTSPGETMEPSSTRWIGSPSIAPGRQDHRTFCPVDPFWTPLARSPYRQRSRIRGSAKENDNENQDYGNNLRPPPLMPVAGFVALTLALSTGAVSVSASSERNRPLRVTEECSVLILAPPASSARSRPRTSRGSRSARGSTTTRRLVFRRACWTVTSSSTQGTQTGRSAVAPFVLRPVSDCARSRTGRVRLPPGSMPVSRWTARRNAVGTDAYGFADLD